jgi:dTDP-4-dehydrorhamnose 3,5-epimerase
MNITPTAIDGCLLIQPKVHEDDRGYFVERFNAGLFAKVTGLKTQFVQDNESKSTYGVVRGLHMQTGDMAQAKLVHVPVGGVKDVVVDLRPKSSSFLKHIVVSLDDENRAMLYIPEGCAHGFSVCTSVAIFQYKCSNFYSKEHEAGVNVLDSELDINWGIPASEMLISDKDMALPYLKHFDFHKI